jgi:hypothetical protein
MVLLHGTPLAPASHPPHTNARKGPGTVAAADRASRATTSSAPGDDVIGARRRGDADDDDDDDDDENDDDDDDDDAAWVCVSPGRTCALPACPVEAPLRVG